MLTSISGVLAVNREEKRKPSWDAHPSSLLAFPPLAAPSTAFESCESWARKISSLPAI